MKAGAVDFLEKPTTSEILLETISRLLRRAVIQQAEFARTNAARVRLASLTPREFEVLRLVVCGKLNKWIAHALVTSESPWKNHLALWLWSMMIQVCAEASKGC